MGKEEQNRQVLLFMDNAGVHNSAVTNAQLNHTQVIFFPKTQRAVLNPRCRGNSDFQAVVKKKPPQSRASQLKQKFQNEISEDPYKTISIVLVISFGPRGLGVKYRTISRCFSKFGFLRNEGAVANIEMPEATLEQLELQAMEVVDTGIVFAPAKTIKKKLRRRLAG